LGKLPDDASESIAAHVGSCAECQAALATIDDADDTFIRRLREPGPADPCLAESECELAVGRAVAAALAEPHGRGSAGRQGPVPTLPLQLGEYQLLELLGSGAMGAVYKAVHTKLDRLVAVKVLARGRLADERALGRFEREMRAIGRLEHPNIVRAYDAREIEGMPVLVMEYIDGLDLGELVRRLGPLPVADACELARQVAVALQYAQQHGLVHRDVKPSNIMLDRSGQVKLLDLGLARLRLAAAAPEQQITDTGQALGTADYIAPEQVTDSRTADIRADIYSLGCTLYKLLAGRAPFETPRYASAYEKLTAHRVSQPQSIRELAQAPLPAELADLLDRMLAKSPQDRPASPQAVAEALGPFCTGSDLAALAARAADAAPPGRTAHRPAATAVRAEPQPAAKPARRVPLATAVAMSLLSAAAGFLLGVIITIRYQGKETTINVPDGSHVEVEPDGRVQVTLPGGADRPEAQAGAGVPDQKAIEGTWQILSAYDSGRQPPKKAPVMLMVFAGNRFMFQYRDPESGPELVSGTFTLDPSLRPKSIDLLPQSGGTVRPGTKWLGIYELKGDRLRICFNESGAPRPNRFASEPNSPNDVLLELRRIGPAPIWEQVQAAREAANRARSREKLKRIALAMHLYHDANKHFPPAYRADKSGKPLLSWRVLILPYLGKQAYQELYKQFHLDEPWDSPHNKKLIAKMPDVYRAPADKPDTTTPCFFVLVGPEAAFTGGEGVPIRAIRDGCANTLLVVEARRNVPWTKPEDIRIEPGKPLPKLGGIYKGGFHAAYADASVSFIPDTTPAELLRKLITRAGGEPVMRRP